MGVRICVSMDCTETRSRDRCMNGVRLELPKEICDDIRKFAWKEAEAQGWQVDWRSQDHDLCPVCREVKP